MSDKYEPFRMDAFTALVKAGYWKGNYGGRVKHFTLTITMEGEFEGFSGRATEAWENRFVVETPDGKFTGETVEVACRKALEAVNLHADA